MLLIFQGRILVMFVYIFIQAYSASQTLQVIILLATGTNNDGATWPPKACFCVCILGSRLYGQCSTLLRCKSLESLPLFPFGGRYIIPSCKLQKNCRTMFPGNVKLTLFLNIDYLCIQVLGGLVVIIMLPLVARPNTQSISYVFTHFEMDSDATGITSKPYAIILSVILSNYSLYGYDAAAHLTEETKGADRTGPRAILSSIGIISVFGWAYNLALTFSIKVLSSLPCS